MNIHLFFFFLIIGLIVFSLVFLYYFDKYLIESQKKYEQDLIDSEKEIKQTYKTLAALDNAIDVYEKEIARLKKLIKENNVGVLK